jgi:hypothetical protein
MVCFDDWRTVFCAFLVLLRKSLLYLEDKMLGALLFGAPVLYSAQPIPREDVPQGWYCYDLRGTARHPDEPHALVDLAEENHAGSILSYLPLKKGGSQFRLVKDMFQMTGTNPSLAEFCAEEKIRCPETPVRHQLCPAWGIFRNPSVCVNTGRY